MVQIVESNASLLDARKIRGLEQLKEQMGRRYKMNRTFVTNFYFVVGKTIVRFVRGDERTRRTCAFTYVNDDHLNFADDENSILVGLSNVNITIRNVNRTAPTARSVFFTANVFLKSTKNGQSIFPSKFQHFRPIFISFLLQQINNFEKSL